jgi:sec-independent protein translocase protein TatC
MSTQQTDPQQDHDPKEAPLVAHLIELRDRIIRSVAAILIVFVLLVNWSNDIYTFVVDPLLAALPEGVSMIGTNPLDGFFAPFKLTFMVAFCITVPYILHQAWAFISPGLYRNEIRVTFPILVSSVLLFYVGLGFCYFVVLGFLFKFFISSAPVIVTMMPDIKTTLDLILKFFFAFGIIFEIPVATTLLVMSGVTTPKDLAAKRPYVVIACFVIGMFLTPPDPFSQSMLAIPMWMLFELGILSSKLFYKEDEAEASAESESSN